MKNVNELIEHIQQDNPVEFLFFWGHQKPKTGIGKSCFSQWYEVSFEANGNYYKTAEHFMMAEKAKLFGDSDSEQKAIDAGSPKEAKNIGRSVKGFNENTWLKHRFEIVVNANIAKFSQNKDLLNFLLDSKDSILVEASPADNIWGIGLAADDESSKKPQFWKGENLLGFALMEVRDRLKK